MREEIMLGGLAALARFFEEFGFKDPIFVVSERDRHAWIQIDLGILIDTRGRYILLDKDVIVRNADRTWAIQLAHDQNGRIAFRPSNSEEFIRFVAQYKDVIRSLILTGERMAFPWHVARLAIRRALAR